MEVPLEYPGLTAMKEEDAEWSMLPSKDDDPLLTCPSSSDEEEA